MNVEEVIFDVAELLRVPVLILVLAALAVVLVESGAFAMELARRRRRDTARLEQTAVRARDALAAGDVGTAQGLLWQVAWSHAMAGTLALMAARARGERADDRLAKALADFDFTLDAQARAHAGAGPARPGAGADGDADPAVAGARRARRRGRRSSSPTTSAWPSASPSSAC